jgi:hypothetical protein
MLASYANKVIDRIRIDLFYIDKVVEYLQINLSHHYDRRDVDSVIFLN